MDNFFIIHSAHPCTELILDINQVRGYLELCGLRETSDISSADYIFVTTCAFNQQYENDAVASINTALSSKKNGARVIVSGCLSKINPELFKTFSGVESLAPSETEKIEEIIPSEYRVRDVAANTVSVEEYSKNKMFTAGIRLKSFFQKIQRVVPFIKPPAWLDTVPMPDWYFIRGATGCLGNCSYCAIKRSRGNVRSTPPDKIIFELEKAVRNGYREISFAGDDMGCYGMDAGFDLSWLFDEIVKLKGDFNINIRFIEPIWLIKNIGKLERAFKSGRIKSFCAPLQSGSQRILKLMNRHYKISDAAAVIDYILENTRVRSISSIVMVGFPGETAEDFKKSYELLSRVKVNVYQALKYEGREGAPSEAMENKVDENIKDIRQQRFLKKMKLTKFLGLSDNVAEKIVSAKFGGIV